VDLRWLDGDVAFVFAFFDFGGIFWGSFGREAGGFGGAEALGRTPNSFGGWKWDP